ncbi:hypothetical protein RJ639_003201 [Escallonia herrerae]|uniref:Uncharacterized protein n=1 Tax=Escallonia herrerae TaxID=1293975 RepID=A0AA89AWF2_9ASTE|nr:hypothetical protein RJ639_003201 [Escallonia herrerae]
MLKLMICRSSSSMSNRSVLEAAGLRVVEAADHGPDGGDGRGDGLDHGGAALVGPGRVGVVVDSVLRYGLRRGDPPGGRVGLLLALHSGRIFGAVDSVELHRRRHVLGFVGCG